MTWRDILKKAKGALGIKAISEMTLEEVEAELKKLSSKIGKTKSDLDRQGALLDRKIELESKPHTGFQTQKVW